MPRNFFFWRHVHPVFQVPQNNSMCHCCSSVLFAMRSCYIPSPFLGSMNESDERYESLSDLSIRFGRFPPSIALKTCSISSRPKKLGEAGRAVKDDIVAIRDSCCSKRMFQIFANFVQWIKGADQLQSLVLHPVRHNLCALTALSQSTWS